MVWSPCCPRDSQESSPTPQFESINSSVLSLLYGPTLTSIHNYWKNHTLSIGTFVSKVMSLLFDTLSRFVIAILPRSKRLLILWLQSPSAVILEPKKMKSDTVFTVSSSIWHEDIGPNGMILVLWMLSFKPDFSVSFFTFIKRLCSSSSLSAIKVVSSAYLRLLTFLPAILIPACESSSPTLYMMYSVKQLSTQHTQKYKTLCLRRELSELCEYLSHSPSPQTASALWRRPLFAESFCWFPWTASPFHTNLQVANFQSWERAPVCQLLCWTTVLSKVL